MLDCGSAAHEVLQVGADIGLKIVVLDHHGKESLYHPYGT